MSEWTEEKRFLNLLTSLGQDKFLLRSFSGEDGISELFHFHLDLLSEAPGISFDDIIGKTLTFSVRLAVPDNARYFNGYVSRFVQLPGEERLYHYQAEVVPWLWFLTRTADCKIFQDMNVLDIVKKVFTDLKFTDFQDRTQKTYPVWDYCVQYRETAFNFVSRLMEQEGIYYFFDHEKDKHTLVLADRPSAHKSCPGQPKGRLDFTPGGFLKEDVVHNWQMEQELRNGKYSLKDYNFEAPSTDLGVKEPSIINVDGNS